MRGLIAAGVFTFVAILICGLMDGTTPRAMAQKKDAEKFVPAPQCPTLTEPVGFSARIGGITELTLAGTNLLHPTGVLVGEPLKAAISPKNVNDNSRVTVRIDVPPDTPVGIYRLRVATKSGVSSVKPLVIDDLPEVREATDNTSKDKAQPVIPPCVIVGKVDAESADFYHVSVKAGQTLTFEVVGRRMGSPIDPLVVLHDAKTKRELISLYADDTPGLQGDARLTHTFKQAAEIIVEVRDTTYRGGANFTYRLRIGEFPGVTTAFPLALQRGQSTQFGFSGPGADQIPAVPRVAPLNTKQSVMWVVPKFPNGLSGWPVPVRLSDHPELVEKEPNNDPATATSMPIPGGVSARFGVPNDIDYFRFEAKKGQKLALTVLAYELNAPTEVLLRVVDDKGKELGKSNPAQANVRVDFTPPADGTYYAVCEHLNFLSGPNEVYHLAIRPITPDFEFSLPVDNFEALVAGATAIPLTNISRLNGFQGPIEFHVVGDPVISGQVIAAPDATAVYLPIHVAKEAQTGPYRFRVEGRAGGTTRFGTTVDLVKLAFANLPNPPLDFVAEAAVGVTDEAPFTITLSPENPQLEKGQPGIIQIQVTRRGYDGEIGLSLTMPPSNATVGLKPIAKGSHQGQASIAGTASGPAVVTLKATAKIGGKDYTTISHPVTITVIEPKKVDSKKEPAQLPKK